MRNRLTMIAVTLLATLGLVAVGTNPAAAAPAQAPAATLLDIPVTGTTENGGTFAGTFTPAEFVAQDGALLATGTLTGTLTDAAGQPVGTVSEPVSMPAAVAAATCRILDLTLGPLHLDLLGLVVDLNQVHLTINANAVPGGLLGNLLCAVAHLLDGTPSAGALAALLNFLLSLLNQS